MPDKKPTTAQPQRKMLTPDQLQELYGITFSDGERILLTRSNDLLNMREEQWAYLLKMALTPLRCPACQGVICQRSADRDWNPQIHMPDDAYVCPLCQAQLTWYLEITGGQGFTLNPGQTITIGQGPAAPEDK